MLRSVVILTGNELRHQFFRKKIASNNKIRVLKTFCESEDNLIIDNSSGSFYRASHLKARNQSEKDFFEAFLNTVSDQSNSVLIKRGSVNDYTVHKEISSLNPDLLIVFGSSILKEPLLAKFNKRILNVHLGLTPYYRGAASNFWALADNYPECVGATFMFIDAGIDTGEIIHQIRATINYYDTPSTIGNRLIKDMTNIFERLIMNFDKVKTLTYPLYPQFERVTRKKDFSESAVIKLYQNFSNGMIEKYIESSEVRNSLFPIIQNPALC